MKIIEQRAKMDHYLKTENERRLSNSIWREKKPPILKETGRFSEFRAEGYQALTAVKPRVSHVDKNSPLVNYSSKLRKRRSTVGSRFQSSHYKNSNRNNNSNHSDQSIRKLSFRNGSFSGIKII